METQKTIIITEDDAARMLDFCKDKEGATSKSFFDWYLIESVAFFATKGMVIYSDIVGGSESAAIAFDFTDPDRAEFSAYVYSTQEIVTTWEFKRQENLLMKEIDIHITYANPKFFTDPRTMFAHEKLRAKFVELAYDVKNIDKQLKKRLKKRGGPRMNKTKYLKVRAEVMKDTIRIGGEHVNQQNCKYFTGSIYALMYYVSRISPKEVTTAFRKDLEAETGGVKVKSIYQYTGYVDLRENRVYRPIIEKNPGDPVREYQRHIDAWTVRGHYRKTRKGLVWIAEHVKGHGEVENRVYATVDERELDLPAKTFEVERTVKNGHPNEGVRVAYHAEAKPYVVQEKTVEVQEKVDIVQEKPSIVKRLLRFLKLSK